LAKSVGSPSTPLKFIVRSLAPVIKPTYRDAARPRCRRGAGYAKLPDKDGKEYLRFDEIEDVLSSLDLLALVTPLLKKHPRADNGLATELASVLVDDRAVALAILVQRNAGLRAPRQSENPF
jgi:hypothetical protein